jgi:uncharacterized protein YecA (UPF0149 family)
MMERVEDQVVQYMFRAELREPPTPQYRRPTAHSYSKPEASALAGERREAQHSPTAGPPSTVRRTAPKVGRNDPCPCGSGKKFKKCCGLTADATS